MIKTLIVEDNKVFRRTLKNFLTGESNIEIIAEVESGPEAVETAAKKAPDLVIMDIRMPGGSGLSATSQIKKSNPDIKVVMLTLWDEKELRDEAAKRGADAYVIKNKLYGSLIPTIKRLFNENYNGK